MTDPVDHARAALAAAIIEATGPHPCGPPRTLAGGKLTPAIEAAAVAFAAKRAAASRFAAGMTPALERWEDAARRFVARIGRPPSVRELAFEAGRSRTPAAAAIARLKSLERWNAIIGEVGPPIPGSPPGSPG